MHTKVLIIGSGAAGYTAAIYAARAALEPILISGWQLGGQLVLTTDVENFPGFKDVIQGPWLMEQMRLQAEKVGTRIIDDQVTKVDLQHSCPFQVWTEFDQYFTCDTMIICTGAQARWLKLPSETFYRGFGVSGCATCDGSFFKDKVVCVVGGGNTAMTEALDLTHHAAKVYIIHRRDQFRAEQMLQEKVLKNPKIEVLWEQAVDEILGIDKPFKSVTGIRLKHTKSGALSELPLDGVFIAIGHTPSTKLFEGQIQLDSDGYIVTKFDRTHTSVPGVFAAGDVRDKVYRQAITAAGQGCMAALDADQFLKEIYA